MLTAPLIILGQILGFAFAAGLNLYATLALLGIASRLGWIAVPPGARGVENWVVLITAAILYFVEFFIDKIPYADTVWDVVHTIVRPLAAACLVGAALAQASFPVQLGGALLAGGTALGAHGIKAGLRLIINVRPKKALNTAISLFEDICAVALAVAVLRYPVAALILAAVALPIVLLCGPRLWRAAVLAVRAVAARLRGFFGRRDWGDEDDLPPRLRPFVPALAMGRGRARVARAALRGVKGVGSYKNGWVVLGEGPPIFLYLSFLRPRSLPMPAMAEPQVRHGIWADTVEFTDGKGRCTLFLLKDGPRAELALAELNAIKL